MAVNQLKVVVNILHEISEGNTPKAEDYGIDTKKYYDILEAMQHDGLIKNASFSRGAINSIIMAFYEDVKITIRGMEYLNQNSTLMKTYKGLKEIKKWLLF